MSSSSVSNPSEAAAIPPDDPRRQLAVIRPESDDDLQHLALAGGIYTIVLSGEQTDGRYCLIEMRIPAGGGPPPHRHDFEEMFTVLEGRIRFTFRGEDVVVNAGETVNVPANAPHFFRNVSEGQARMLCVCAPAGQDEYFAAVATPVEAADSPPPALTGEQLAETRARAVQLAARYRTELL